VNSTRSYPPQSNPKLYKTSVTYINKTTGAQVQTSFDTNTNYAIGSSITVYTSPDAGSTDVCDSTDNHTIGMWMIIIGIFILVSTFIWGILLYNYKTLRAGYGVYCGFEWLSSLFSFFS